ncbi:MAG TPA: RNA polymerase sigma factor [Opitutus sp.]|nr:RNA polymerase sigma factor [Opitutus sp.]
MKGPDLAALHALYVENRRELYSYAVAITGNREAAEDAIHGVFERLLRGGGLPADLRPYVFRAIRNAAYDAWRRSQVRKDSIFDLAASVDEVAAGAGRPAGGEDLEPLLQRLSPDERETIVLRIHGGHTFQQIAALRGVPLSTAASWYRRGLERLRIMLAEEQ